MLGNFFAADDFSRRHFQMHFFLGALRVNIKCPYRRMQFKDIENLAIILVPLIMILSRGHTGQIKG